MRPASFRQLGVISIFVALSVLAVPAYAQQSPIPLPDLSNPNIEISTSSLPYIYVDTVEVTTDANNLITGTFTALSGEEKATISDIQYELFLLAKPPDGSKDAVLMNSAPVIERHVVKDTFTLTPQETKQISISYQAPQVPEGEYILRVQLRASTGREMGWEDTTVTLKGADSFIIIQPQSVDVTATNPFTQETKDTWAPREGPNVLPDAPLTLTANLQSISSVPLTVTPTVDVTRDLLADQPTATTTGSTIMLKPNEQKTVSIPIRAAMQPGAYEVLLTLNQNNQRISGIAEFRYVVEGISASIVSHRIQQFPTRKGGTAVIDFFIAGSADRKTQGGGTVEVAILEDDAVAGSATVSVDSFDMDGTATVPLVKDVCHTPTLRIVLATEGGQVLDTYETNVDVPVDCATPGDVQQSVRSNKTVGMVVVLGIIVVVLVGSLVILYRKRTGLPPDDTNEPTQGSTTPSGPSGGVTSVMILLIIVLPLVLIASRTPADASHAEGHVQVKMMPDRLKSAIFIFINKPRHNQTLYSDTFAYEMRYEFAACGNDIGDALISVLVPPHGGHLGPSDYMPDYEGVKEHDEPWIVLVDKVRRESHGERAGNSFSTTLIHPSPLPDESTLLTIVAFRARFKRYGGGYTYTYFYVYDYTWINFAQPSVSPSPSVSVSPSPSPTPSPIPTPTPSVTPTPPPGTTECSDGIDNDGDTFIDCTEGNSDPGCYTDILDPETCDPLDDDEYHIPQERNGGFGETD